MSILEPFTLHTTHATVLKTNRWSETHISGGGGGGSQYQGSGSTYVAPITSHTVSNLEIWLRTDSGQEVSYTLRNLTFKCMEGQQVSFVSAAGKQAGAVYYVAAWYNHATGDSVLDSSQARMIAKDSLPRSRRGGTYFGAAWLLYSLHLWFVSSQYHKLADTIILGIGAWIASLLITQPQISYRTYILKRLLKKELSRLSKETQAQAQAA